VFSGSILDDIAGDDDGRGDADDENSDTQSGAWSYDDSI